MKDQQNAQRSARTATITIPLCPRSFARCLGTLVGKADGACRTGAEKAGPLKQTFDEARASGGGEAGKSA